VLLAGEALQELHALPGEVREVVDRGDWLEAVDLVRVEQGQDVAESVEHEPPSRAARRLVLQTV
jgi:hypothetical protein